MNSLKNLIKQVRRHFLQAPKLWRIFTIIAIIMGFLGAVIAVYDFLTPPPPRIDIAKELYRWEPIQTPEGAVVRAIASDPTKPGVIFAGTDKGQVFRSNIIKKEGWNEIFNSPYPCEIRQLVPFKSFDLHGVFVVSKCGLYWTDADGREKASTYSEGGNFYSMTGWIDEDGIEIYGGVESQLGTGLVRFNGEIWEDLGFFVGPVISLASYYFETTDEIYLYFSTKNGGLYSLKKGEKQYHEIFASDKAPPMYELHWHPNENRVLYGAGPKGLFRMDLSPLRPKITQLLDSNEVGALYSFCFDDEGEIIISSLEKGVLMVKTDNEKVLQVEPRNLGLPSLSPLFTVRKISGTTNTFAIASIDGVYILDNNKWNLYAEGLKYPEILSVVQGKNKNEYYVLTRWNGLWRLRIRDRHVDYIKLNIPTASREINSPAEDPFVPGKLLVGTADDGVYLSTDNGKTWKPSSKGLKDAFVTFIHFDQTNENMIFCGIAGGKGYKPPGYLYWSQDGGDTWNLHSRFYTAPIIIAQNSKGWIIAGTAGGEILFTKEPILKSGEVAGLPEEEFLQWESLANDSLVQEGLFDISTMAKKTMVPLKSWETISGKEIVVGEILSLTFDPNDPNTIYAGTKSRGLFKTLNLGKEWQTMNLPPGFGPIKDVLVDPDYPKTLYIAIPNRGVFVTTDDGKNWQIIGQPITANSLSPGPSALINLICGTIDQGLFGFSKP